MTSKARHTRLTVNAITAAKPRAKEYTLWDGSLAHFGVRVHPSGVRSFIVQARAQGRMRKITLGRFPEMGIGQARREAAAMLVRLWGGEPVPAPRKKKVPLFRDFAARYRERRKHRWKPASLETFDGYMRNRLMPAFGRMRLDAIDHARVSAWFDAASVDRPGAANRAFEVLRAMLAAARQWGRGWESTSRTPAPTSSRTRASPWRAFSTVTSSNASARSWTATKRNTPGRSRRIRLLTLTGARLSEVLDLKWDEIGELGEDGASARLEDSKTGPRTVWLGREAAKLLAELPRCGNSGRVFPEDLTSQRPLHVLVRHSRESRAARPSHPRLPSHLGLAGRHERRRPDNGGPDARAPKSRDHRDLRPSRRHGPARCRGAGGVRHRAGDELQGPASAVGGGDEGRPGRDPPESTGASGPDSPGWLQTPHWLDFEDRGAETTQPKPGLVDRPPSPTGDMAGSRADSASDDADEDDRERRRRELLWDMSEPELHVLNRRATRTTVRIPEDRRFRFCLRTLPKPRCRGRTNAGDLATSVGPSFPLLLSETLQPTVGLSALIAYPRCGHGLIDERR